MLLPFDKKNKNISYELMKDEDIVTAAREDDSLASGYLISKYQKLVSFKSRSYYLNGGDEEDLKQEGLMGLDKAIKSYDSNKLTSFKVFAEICIKRQMITAIKASTRQKHIPLNSYVSLNQPIYYNESKDTLLDVLEDYLVNDPEQIIINKEDMELINKKIKELLSELEVKVFTLYLDDYSYKEISEELNISIKSIDNTLQRIKKKLKKIEKMNIEIIY